MWYFFYSFNCFQGNLNGLKPEMMVVLLTNAYGILPHNVRMVSMVILPLQGLLPWWSKPMLFRGGKLLTTSEQVRFREHVLTRLSRVRFPTPRR